MGISFFDVSVVIERWERQDQLETLHITADVRNGRSFGQHERVIPADLDSALLWHHVTAAACAELNYPNQRALQARRQLSLDDAVTRVRRAVEDGSYEDYDSELRWADRRGFYFIGSGERASLDKQVAQQVASSHLPDELTFLVQRHPSTEIRRQAIRNQHCPRTTRLWAAQHIPALRSSLLELPIDREIVEELAKDIALRPGYPLEAAQVAALPDCPADLVRGLIE